MLLTEICKTTIQVETLLELSMDKLHHSTDAAFPSRTDSSGKVRIRSKSYLKYDSDKLLIKADCQGEEGDYETSILFEGVTFTDPSDPMAIQLGDLYIQPISNRFNAKVRCTCQDFRWTFSWYNASNDSLIGDPAPPYQKTTNRPPRNPTNAPGMCKHLLKLSKDIQAEQAFS